MLAEHPPSPPPVASFLAKSSSVAVPGQPGVSDSVRSADLTAQPEEPVAPAAPTQDFVSGPEAMFSSAVPSTPPVFLVTPQMVVELMRMHGTNASMTTPYTLESPIFLPPAPPASRATYHSSPPPKP
jgi:hypothetical protein